MSRFVSSKELKWTGKRRSSCDVADRAAVRQGLDHAARQRTSRCGATSQAISTGSLGLDIALGVGGLPRGRIVEIYGPESSGKTTLTLHVVAEAQKRGGVCAFIDAEHALDVGLRAEARRRTEDLLVSQPDTGEQALEIADMLGALEAPST